MPNEIMTDAPIEDLTGVEAASGGAGQAPNGKHLMMISGVESEDKGKEKGMMHSVAFEVVGGENAGKVATENFCMWVPFGKSKFVGLLTAAGFPPPHVGLRTSILKGRLALVTVENEPFVVKDGKDAGKTVYTAKAKAFESGTAAMQNIVSGAAAPAVAKADGARVAF